MNATLVSKAVSTRYEFSVDHDNGRRYDVVIWTNEKGKFDATEVSLNGEILEEGDLEDNYDLLTYVENNWEKLTGEKD